MLFPLLEYSSRWYQVGHALRDAGAEHYRKQHRFVRKEELLHSPQTLHGRDFVSIISEDEGDTSDADDTASSSYSHYNDDLLSPMKVDVEKPFSPRLSFSLLNSFAMTESADHTSDFSNEPESQRIFHTDESSMDPFSRAEISDSIVSNVPFSDIFLRFIEDTGDDADIEVASINPRDWLSS